VAENVAAATIGRAIKIWRETNKARRASAAELIGRAIKNWRETVWPCWRMNWRAWLEDCYRDGERPGLVEVWQADKCLRRFVWHTERRWLAQRRTVRAARQLALASAVARVWKVHRKGRIVAVATIGRAIKNWKETARVRRETAAELIGRVVKNWRETILSIAPCWKENWSPYCRPWLSWRESLRAISNAELGVEIVTEMNHWLGSYCSNGCIRNHTSGGCIRMVASTQPPPAVLEGPPDGAVPLPRL
jgi:hypothetical protein